MAQFIPVGNIVNGLVSKICRFRSIPERLQNSALGPPESLLMPSNPVLHETGVTVPHGIIWVKRTSTLTESLIFNRKDVEFH